MALKILRHKKTLKITATLIGLLALIIAFGESCMVGSGMSPPIMNVAQQSCECRGISLLVQDLRPIDGPATYFCLGGLLSPPEPDTTSIASPSSSGI